MRLSLIAAFACVLLASVATRVQAAPTTSLDISAKHVDYYSNRYIITADGNVRVRLSDGTIVRGETFTMDLKLNRYLIAGDVHLDGAKVHETGAAFAGYPDLDRSYFLPSGGVPDRWTYFGMDFSNPHPGREQPGDAFYFPDLSSQKPYIIAHGVRIIPKSLAIFDEAGIDTLGVFLPTPRYVVVFSANSHYYENGFFGARFDVGVPFNGSEHSLTALHLRNDPINGTYLAFDQHFVWDRDWMVLSIDPLTQEERQYNLIGFKHFSPNLEGRLFTQVTAANPGIINSAQDGAEFDELDLNAGLRRSGLQYIEDNYYQYILAYHQDNDPDPRHAQHPTNMALGWTGYPNRVGKATPFFFRLRSGIGLAHDVYGEGGYAGLPAIPEDAWYHYVGATLYTPAIKLPKGYSLTGLYDRQRTWYSLPHHTDIGDLRFTLAKTANYGKLNSYAAYEIKTTDDYWGALQTAVYPEANTVTTAFGTFSGQAAFRGLATQRTLSASTVYTPTQYFALNLSLTRAYDSPAPVPGLYGEPPLQFAADLRIRLARQVLLDLGRAYYFNFADERWTPQFGIQFSP